MSYRVFRVFDDKSERRISTVRSLKRAKEDAFVYALISCKGLSSTEIREMDGRVIRRVSAQPYMPRKEFEAAKVRLTKKYPPAILEMKKKLAAKRICGKASAELETEIE